MPPRPPLLLPLLSRLCFVCAVFDRLSPVECAEANGGMIVLLIAASWGYGTPHSLTLFVCLFFLPSDV
jgi:hypothetical protein